MSFQRVSIHGGHSGQFCNHAQDSLEAVVQAYIDQGFAWVGLTEHMPPAADRFLYPDEQQAGLNAQCMRTRFDQYMASGRRLQAQYAWQIKIYVGFETEAYTGYQAHVQELRQTHQPDFIVGAVHHVNDIPFDSSPTEYQRAIDHTGGIEALYCRYFDKQYEMISTLKPEVVAHFDLIRIFDTDYGHRWKHPQIQACIMRNLNLIRQLDLILDYNIAALYKGAVEPYISEPILKRALDMGISVVPGDDSHGVDTVGAGFTQGITILQQAGVDITRWRKPINKIIEKKEVL